MIAVAKPSINFPLFVVEYTFFRIVLSFSSNCCKKFSVKFCDMIKFKFRVHPVPSVKHDQAFPQITYTRTKRTSRNSANSFDYPSR